MSRMQREKGKRGEREVVDLAKEHGLDARRTWETAQGIVGDPRCDVAIEDAAYQVKRRSTFKFLYDSIEGVQGVFLRQDGGDWLALVPAGHYLDLLRGEKES